MSELHQFKCDVCNRKVDSAFNGEHHLPPEDWCQLYDHNLGEALKIHICDKCIPHKLKNKLKEIEK